MFKLQGHLILLASTFCSVNFALFLLHLLSRWLVNSSSLRSLLLICKTIQIFYSLDIFLYLSVYFSLGSKLKLQKLIQFQAWTSVACRKVRFSLFGIHHWVLHKWKRPGIEAVRLIFSKSIFFLFYSLQYRVCNVANSLLKIFINYLKLLTIRIV